MAKSPKRIVQISDCHLFSSLTQSLLSVNTHESLSAIIERIQSLNPTPKIIIASGDVSQDNSKKSYESFIEILKILNVPVYAIPGNHDDIVAMKSLFPKKHIILEPWQIILLNSQKPKCVEGYLDEQEFNFLENCLQSHPHLYSIIFFHHHPIAVGSQWLDKIGLSNKENFWKRLSAYKNVKAVFFGHAHQEITGTVNDIPCFGTPSTCIQFKKNHADFALDNLPPGFRWIDLYDDGTIKTEVIRLDHYIGVFEKDAKGYE